MMNLVKTAFVAVTLATAGLATTATTASADSFGFSITVGNGGGYYHNGGHRHGGWNNPRPHRGICSPNRALNKARHMGIRHARIIRANNRAVTVKGRKFGHHVRATFANVRSCPVIAWR